MRREGTGLTASHASVIGLTSGDAAQRFGRDPRYGSVTGRMRDWRKFVATLLVTGVVVAGAPPAVAESGSTGPLKTLTNQFPLGGQKLCCRSHSRARSPQRDSAGSATGQRGRAALGTSVLFVGSVALLALLLFLLGRELSAAFRSSEHRATVARKPDPRSCSPQTVADRSHSSQHPEAL